MNHGRISGCTLKMIAVVTMFIDHLAAAVIYRALLSAGTGFVTADNYHIWYWIYYVMRGIGRMAFPLYCFLLVEGFVHTHSVARYALRLFLFALISEIPFDLAFNFTWLEFGYNNVYFTLLLGLLAIAAMDALNGRLHRTQIEGDGRQTQVSGERQSFIQIAGNLAIALTAMLAAEYLLCTDYAAAGIMAILVMYLFRERPLLGFAFAVVLLGLFSSTLEFAALLMLIPLFFYNGTRGRQVKYFFYAFYPLHLILLVLLCVALGLPVFS